MNEQLKEDLTVLSVNWKRLSGLEKFMFIMVMIVITGVVTIGCISVLTALAV